MNGNEPWRIRATAAEILAMAFAYPTPTLASAVSSGEFAEAAGEAMRLLGADEGLVEGFAAYCRLDAEETRSRLRREHTRLFLSLPRPIASPCAGVWAARDKGAQPMLFNGREAAAIEEAYARFGLRSTMKEPPDHIASCFEFLECLAALRAGLIGDGEGRVRCDAERAYLDFTERHLTPWASRFSRQTQDAAEEPFYTAAAKTLDAFLSYGAS